MRLIQRLLRLLLTVSMVVNGLGLAPSHAMDRQHAPVAPKQPGVFGQAPNGSSEPPPCHRGVAPLVHGSEIAAPAAQVPRDSGSHNCCAIGSCEGVCKQSTFAILSELVFGVDPAPPAPAPNCFPGGAPSPALPHPLRPPIA